MLLGKEETKAISSWVYTGVKIARVVANYRSGTSVSFFLYSSAEQA